MDITEYYEYIWLEVWILLYIMDTYGLKGWISLYNYGYIWVKRGDITVYYGYIWVKRGILLYIMDTYD